MYEAIALLYLLEVTWLVAEKGSFASVPSYAVDYVLIPGKAFFEIGIKIYFCV